MAENKILESIIGKNYESVLKKYRKQISNDHKERLKEIKDEKGVIYVCSDIHGDLNTYVKTLDLFLKTLLNGENTYWIKTGDLIHGLEEYSDESIEIMKTEIELKNTVGDASIYLIGDHEWAQLKNKEIRKFGKNQTEDFKRSLKTDELNEILHFINSLPLIVKVKDYIFSHSGPILSLNSIEHLKNLDYFSLDFEKNKLIEEIVWGNTEYSEKEVQGVLKRIRTNVYSYSEMNDFLEKMKAKVSIQGHSGVAKNKIIHSNGFYQIIDGVGEKGYLIYPDLSLIIISTTESKAGSKNIIAFNIEDGFGKIDITDISKYRGNPDDLIWKQILLGSIDLENKIENKKYNEEHEEHNKIKQLEQKIDEMNQTLQEILNNKKDGDFGKKIMAEEIKITKEEKIKMIAKAENLSLNDSVIQLINSFGEDVFEDKIKTLYEKGIFKNRKPY